MSSTDKHHPAKSTGPDHEGKENRSPRPRVDAAAEVERCTAGANAEEDRRGRRSDEGAALRLKGEGNGLFAKHLFADASSRYTEALALLDLDGDYDDGPGCGDAVVGGGKEEGEDTTTKLRAVLLSNRSNCRFELGDYDGATSDAEACVALLDGGLSSGSVESSTTTNNVDLLGKNLWRLARALHYSKNDGGVVPGRDYVCAILRRLEDLSLEPYSKRASKMLEQLRYYERLASEINKTETDGTGDDDAPPNDHNYTEMPVRPSLQDPYREYYNFGHDMSESVLRHEEIESQSIHLVDLNDDELSSLSFLFGGVGDARHVMATLLDAHHQWCGETLDDARRDRLRLRFTMNDINAQVLAKDMLVLVLSHEMARMAKDMRTLVAEREPFLLGAVAMYATLGYVMPPVVHEKLIECVRTWFTESSHEEFRHAFPWLQISSRTWDEIVVDGPMASWVDPVGEKGYAPSLLPVKGALTHFIPQMRQSKDGLMSNLAMMGGSSEVMSNMADRHDQAEEERRERRLKMMEMARTMDLTPQMIQTAKAKIGEDATDEQIREFIVETLGDVDDDMLMSASSEVLVSPLDTMFLEHARVLRPPWGGPVQEFDEDLNSIRKGPSSTKEEVVKAIKGHKKVIHSTWKVNPLQYDPLYWKFIDGNPAPDRMNPVKEFPEMFLNEAVQSYMPDPPVYPKSPEDAGKNTLAKCVMRYYWNVGKALCDLSGKVSFEISLGSIVAFGSQVLRNAKDREIQGMPTKYHRISLSNIPDYTGLLSIFCTVTPLLAAKTGSITPSMRSNTLLNTGIWKSYDEYVFSTVALTHKEAEAFFKLRVVDEEPSVWCTFVTWARADAIDDSRAKMVTCADFRRWLHRLYLNIVLPPDRDPSSQIREERSSSVDLFLMTCAACVDQLGYPAHFVYSALDDLLASNHLKTKALLQNGSPPSSLCPENVVRKYNLSAFRLELANRTAIFLQKRILSSKMLSTALLPVSKASRFELKLKGISPTYSQEYAARCGARSSSPALGFMLEKKRNRGFTASSGANDGDSNPMLAMMSMMGGSGMPHATKKPSKLRKALLDDGEAVGHVFSCFQWNLDEQTVSFWMCEEFFQKYASYNFALIRTDGWFCIPHEDAVLGDAKCI